MSEPKLMDPNYVWQVFSKKIQWRELPKMNEDVLQRIIDCFQYSGRPEWIRQVPIVKDDNWLKRCLRNESDVAEIDGYIEMWHEDGKTGLPLSAYLGLTLSEYSQFLKDSSNLKHIIELRKANEDSSD